MCHILQYNRPIIGGGDRLAFFQYWGGGGVYGGYAHENEYRLLFTV